MGELQDSGLSKKATDQDEIARECEALEEELASMRAAYEQYFLGIERQPPTLQYNALKKRVLRLKTAFIRQTALKFRVSSMHNKFSTYERLWQRTLMEIENGTYKRDLFKARLHAKKREAKAEPKAAEKRAAELPAEDDLASALESLTESPRPTGKTSPPPPPPDALRPGAGAAKPGGPPGLRAAGTPPPPPPDAMANGRAPAGPPGLRAAAPARPVSGTPTPVNGSHLTDAKLRAVYDAYVTAKRRCNEDVSKLDYNAVAASLKKQVPELMKKHNAKSVDFKVVIKDGKAVLRAVPKE